MRKIVIVSQSPAGASADFHIQGAPMQKRTILRVAIPRRGVGRFPPNPKSYLRRAPRCVAIPRRGVGRFPPMVAAE